MCKSISVSISTFAITCMSAMYIYRINNEFLYAACFIVTFSVMQLVDAVLWWSINNNFPQINKFISTYVIGLVLCLEILVAFYAAKVFLGWKNNPFEILVWIYVVGLLMTWILNCTSTTKVHELYLFWCNLKIKDYGKWLFLIMILVPVIFAIKDTVIKTIICGIALLSFIVNFNNLNFGSRWCWSANFMSVCLALYALYYNVK